MPSSYVALLVILQWMLLLDTSHAGVNRASGSFSGDGTQYTLTDPNNGNCNFMAFPEEARTKYAALNTPQFKSTANCGRCAQVSCVDDKCQGAKKQSEIVYIMDQCPGCAHGDLDLSPDVFESITGHQNDRVTIQWKFVDCPIQSNMQFCLKSGSNPFWTAVQPTNFVSGVKSLQVNGKVTKMVDSAFYFLLDGNSVDQADLGSLQITVESVNGEKIKQTVSLADGGCVKASAQFSRGTPDTSADFEEAPEVDSAKEEAGVIVTDLPAATPTSSPPSSSESSGSEATSTRPTLLRSAEPSPSPSPPPSSPSSSASSTPVASAANPVGSSDDEPVHYANTSTGDTENTTSPAIIVLSALACLCVIVLIGLAIRLKIKRRKEKQNDLDATYVSDVPRTIVYVHSYDEFPSPTLSPEADKAVW
ncbi:hypothetical protein Poli38472_007345 [Pythium oligandrum]|uniref:Expansin-like EG45 domain-containing protein n=1 Tax=Pythium oligandrum TaxID=41045 RepID=A0A8K1C9X5_PYTOL|nr:hypothetical protein Poli38472_007345 [Pythium oligandrum]|eukprot:TMW59200.1 hypothetical protein Poli38472_007345 [Pythium oligandrum]